jgi:hypothetical protein
MRCCRILPEVTCFQIALNAVFERWPYHQESPGRLEQQFGSIHWIYLNTAVLGNGPESCCWLGKVTLRHRCFHLAAPMTRNQESCFACSWTAGKNETTHYHLPVSTGDAVCSRKMSYVTTQRLFGQNQSLPQQLRFRLRPIFNRKADISCDKSFAYITTYSVETNLAQY